MVAVLPLKQDNSQKLHLDVLPLKTKRAFLACKKLSIFSKNKWYLAGGTAMALQVGHRQSVDLDFFTPQASFNELEVERELLNTGKWQTTYRESGTIYGLYDEAKMSLIAYPFFKPSKDRIKYDNISLILPRDIAVMKIVAISQRGRKRDFYDLFWYIKNREPLLDVVLRATTQYPGQDKNITHIIKSLVYFDDAEGDPMPKILFRASWKEVKSFFRKQAKDLAMKLILK